MTQDRIVHDDSIDLIKIFQIIWSGKWIIIGLSLFIFLCAYIYLLVQPAKEFVAYTKIKPISTFEESDYDRYNSFIEGIPSSKNRAGDLNTDDQEKEKNLFRDSHIFLKIDADLLYELYLEQLQQSKVFEQSIIELNLINRDEFQNDESFMDAVVTLASRIEIKEEESTTKSNIKKKPLSAEIIFRHINEEKWKKILLSVHTKAEENILNNLQMRFEDSLSIMRQNRNFKIDDTLMQIDNALYDYDLKIGSIVAFLDEQAKIAKELGIERSEISTQFFSVAQNELLNIDLNTPLYLKGYQAIEKEIELIKARSNKRSFIPGLVALEIELRNLEQSEKIESRVEELFATTPIVNKKFFSASKLLVQSTSFEYENNDYLILILSILFGGSIGIFYVIISSAFRERKET